ncbi:glutamate-cysteine ligase modifier subunit [Eremomyces bilateralis CBS 781.70]|uniref:GCS light chain n=1 Tax=Eremomyces bilateralis CBS 781.70 TaxID=1392243 RepID=A0A6G1GBM4_9PEZI|nr:glutamate-cysteine ligase modifier subunit [Eremomyces bilateralis CBS 781.70]KAF1815249.1 glutamate-cysteine ligase modifier subunit [Eremomyces bilateralis CBS 781.70]
MKLIVSTSNIMSGGPPLIRQSHAEKSNLELISSLRSNIQAAKDAAVDPDQNGDTKPDDVSNLPLSAWTTTDGDQISVPSLESPCSGLSEDPEQYDITVKLFYLPGVGTELRCAHTREAIALVLKKLRVSTIDLLIVSFPGITFDADDEDEEEPLQNGVADDDATRAEVDMVSQTWRILEQLYEDGSIKSLGLSEFGTNRLQRLLPNVRVKPAVDQINVRDCCVVPKQLIMFGKKESIELLTHNDCTDVLPRGTLTELLGPTDAGVDLLSQLSQVNPALTGNVEPQFVVKYTAVVKDRGVVESKGYFAVANVS